MSIWGHIDALRSMFLRSAAVLCLFAIGLFTVMPWLFDNVILAPGRGDFFLYRWLGNISSGNPLMPNLAADSGFDVHLININLASQFFVHITSSLWCALVLAFPFLLYFVWLFVAPALYKGERKNVGSVFVFGNIMFYLGVLVGYCLVFPITLRFLAEYQLSGTIENQISLDSYMDNFYMLILVMGIVFELPVLAWLLGKAGVVKRDMFTKYRRHAIVVLLILAAVITPTGDPFTLMVVFLPIYILWELGALLTPRPYVRKYNAEAITD